MPLTRSVDFKADFPDDACWDERGNSIRPGGKAIAERLRLGLTQHGFVTSEVVPHRFYGWAFDVTTPAGRAWCLLQAGAEWLFLFEPKLSLLQRLFSNRGQRIMAEMQSTVQEILRDDERFTDVVWHTQADDEKGRRDGARA